MNKHESINKKALKAGLWYTISNVLIRGINFLTTPIFTRLMTKTEYGMYSNYVTWLSLLTILTTLELGTTLDRAKYDYSQDYNQYISSIQCLGTLFTALCYFLVCCAPAFFQELFGLDMMYIHIMFIYLLVQPSFTLFRTKHRMQMKYRSVVYLTVGSVLATMICSLFLVSTMKDRFLGRVIGNTAVLFCLGLALYIYNLIEGRCVRIEDWWYALPIAIPYLPHILAGNILGTTDRIVIMKYCGPEDNALYSLVYSISLIVTLLASSINQAWAPWLYEKLSINAYNDIRQVTSKYLWLTLPVALLLFLVGPELILTFGGEKYRECARLVPYIMAGCYMVMLYTFFVNVEHYHKKTLGISVRTIIAGGFNLLTNLFLVPVIGYEAAAYTTLASYILLLFLHYRAAVALGAGAFYDLRQFVLFAVVVLALMGGSTVLYSMPLARYCVLLSVALFCSFLFVKRRRWVLDIITKKK